MAHPLGAPNSPLHLDPRIVSQIADALRGPQGPLALQGDSGSGRRAAVAQAVASLCEGGLDTRRVLIDLPALDPEGPLKAWLGFRHSDALTAAGVEAEAVVEALSRVADGPGQAALLWSVLSQLGAPPQALEVLGSADEQASPGARLAACAERLAPEATLVLHAVDWSSLPFDLQDTLRSAAEASPRLHLVLSTCTAAVNAARSWSFEAPSSPLGGEVELQAYLRVLAGALDEGARAPTRELVAWMALCGPIVPLKLVITAYQIGSGCKLEADDLEDAIDELCEDDGPLVCHGFQVPGFDGHAAYAFRDPTVQAYLTRAFASEAARTSAAQELSKNARMWFREGHLAQVRMLRALAGWAGDAPQREVWSREVEWRVGRGAKDALAARVQAAIDTGEVDANRLWRTVRGNAEHIPAHRGAAMVLGIHRSGAAIALDALFEFRLAVTEVLWDVGDFESALSALPTQANFVANGLVSDAQWEAARQAEASEAVYRTDAVVGLWQGRIEQGLGRLEAATRTLDKALEDARRAGDPQLVEAIRAAFGAGRDPGA